jgi:mono/diheme cytochrome c family protein
VVQGNSRQAGTDGKFEQAILLLDLSTKQWTRLAVGSHPSVLWGSKSAQYGEIIWERGWSTPIPSTAPDKSLIAQGRTRYLSYKCDECHGPNGEGGGDGPDLIGTRLNAAQISKFLDKPSPDADMKGMPSIPTDNPDNRALVAYVLSLKRPVNPPQSSSPVPHKLTTDEKAHILDGEFTIEKTVDHLPDSLKSAFAHLAKEADFKMANPGEKFEATDDISDPGLPNRRLIFAGISKNRYFIHYEHGGIGYHCDVVVFDVNAEGKVSFLGAGSGRAKDLAELRALVSSKAFGGSDNHW